MFFFSRKVYLLFPIYFFCCRIQSQFELRQSIASKFSISFLLRLRNDEIIEKFKNENIGCQEKRTKKKEKMKLGKRSKKQ